MVCAIGIVPMSRGRRVGIVGIASPPSTAGTRGKTNLSRMRDLQGKIAERPTASVIGKIASASPVSQGRSRSSGVDARTRLPSGIEVALHLDVEDIGSRRVFLLERSFDGFRKILDNCRGSRQQQPLDQPLGHRGNPALSKALATAVQLSDR